LRCKVCSLPKQKRDMVERMILCKIPLRRISGALKRNGITISYAGISRHVSHTLSIPLGKRSQIDDFARSTREFRPVAVAVNLDVDIWRGLRKKRTLLSRKLIRGGLRARATMSSVANYFLEKGTDAILQSREKEAAHRALQSFLKRRASFTNDRRKREQACLTTIMIGKGLSKKLRIDIPLDIWYSKSFEELCELWNDAVGDEPEERWRGLPNPSLTDYVNLALRVGLELEN